MNKVLIGLTVVGTICLIAVLLPVSVYFGTQLAIKVALSVGAI